MNGWPKAGSDCEVSTAQNILVEEVAEAVQALRGRDLSQEEFFCLMLDRVVLFRDVVVIVAIGFCTDRRKMVLSFVRGHTENCELCRELMGRLVKRGFVPVTEYLLAVLDGGNVLSKAGLEFFPTAKVQRGMGPRTVRGVPKGWRSF